MKYTIIRNIMDSVKFSDDLQSQGSIIEKRGNDSDDTEVPILTKQ